ncbi:MAG: asparagine synthase-related protein [Myxococcota bacterium]|nr:asparagine synthase-related protein [Myxococcota bacterium]
MMKLISHRGSQHQCCYLSISGHSHHENGPWQVGLGYSRRSNLSIQQPLAYDGYYWVVFDGHVSNRQELYQILSQSGYRFRTNQDSEIMLASYLHWGLNCFDKIKGQWAVVITDLVQKRAVIAKDRAGAKPLYFQENKRGLVVGSEVKQFRALGSFNLNESHLITWLNQEIIESGQTMFSGVRELLPGCVLTYSLLKFQIESETPYPSEIDPLSGYDDTYAKAAFFRDQIVKETSSQLTKKTSWGVLDDGSFASFVVHDCVSAGRSGTFRSYCPVFAGHNTDMSEPLHQFVAGRGGQINFFAPDIQSFRELFDQFLFAAETPSVNLQMFVAFLAAREMSRANFENVFSSHGVDILLNGQWKDYCSALGKQLFAKDPLHGFTELIGALLAGGNRDLFWQYNSSLLRRLRPPPSILERTISRDESGRNRQRDHSMSVIRDGYTRRAFSQSVVTLEKCVQAYGLELVHPFAIEALVDATTKLDFRDLYRNGWNQYILRLGFGERLPSSLAWNRRDSFRDEMLFDWFAQGITSMFEPLVAKRNASIWSLFSRDRCQKLLEEAKGVRINRRDALKQLLKVFSVHRWKNVFELT